MGWCGINLFLRGDLFGKSLVENPRVISPKKNLFPATFWKMSRPKAKTTFWEFLGDTYPPRHSFCIENTCCEVCLKKIQYTLKDRFPRHFLDEHFGKHLPKLVIKQLPNRSMTFVFPEVSSKAIQKICFNIFLNTAFDPSKRCRIFGNIFLPHISQDSLGVFLKYFRQDFLEISCG